MINFNRLPIALVVFALAGCGDRSDDPRGIDRDETLLSVSAIGQAETRPDEARFTAGVSTTASSAQAVTQRNNEAMAKVTAALTALGVGRDDLRTQRLTVGRIDYGPNRGQFQADNLVEARVRDVDKVGAAVAAATEAGANVLSGPDLRVSDREAANKSAYASAYKAARARAEAYAGAAGLKISRVLAIRDGGETGGPIPYARYATEQSAGAGPRPVSAPPVNPGLETSEVRVQVEFALEAK